MANGLEISKQQLFHTLSDDEQRRLYIQHLEGMQRIADAISKSLDPDAVLLNVLEAVRKNFQVDRAWLIYPCDPQSASFSVSAEATVPEFPGACSIGEEIPTDPSIAQGFHTALDSMEPIVFNVMPLDSEQIEKFSIRSQMMLALKTRFGEPWLLGMHQCDHQRTWSDEEQWMFKETGKRIEDLLGSVFLQSKLKEREQFISRAMDSNLAAIYIYNITTGHNDYINSRYTAITGYGIDDMNAMTQEQFIELFHPEEREQVLSHMEEVIQAEDNDIAELEYRFRTRDGGWVWCLSRDSVFDRDEEGRATRFIGTFLDITNRKQTELVLKESEETQRAIIETSKDWIWAIDLNGKHTYSNPAAKEIIGYTADELINSQTLDLIHPDDRERVNDYLREWIQKEKGWNNLVIRWRHKDGDYRYLESNAVPSLTPEGKLVGFRGVDRDITERVQSEEAIYEREMRLSALFDSAVDGILIADPQTSEFISCNKMMAKMLGYRPEEVIGLKVKDLHYEEDLPNVYEQFERITSEKVTEGKNIPFRRKDGSVFYADVGGFPFMIGGKRYIGGFFKDITGRKLAEEKLRQAATVFENATDGIIITDTQGTIISINRAASELTGYSEEEVVGKNPSIWKSDRHDESFFQEMWASLKQHDQWQGEIWNRRKNGEVFPCWQSISAVRNGDAGENKHYVSIMSDITAIKESQERLQHLAHHDPLTNLPNRLLFNARLEHAMERAHREKSEIGVMFLDLDNFKPINDGLGHPVGDKVLQAVAERLTIQVRGEDTVARIAGDEFAIILEDIGDSQDVSHVAGKILSAFEESFQIEGQELHVNTSIGISLYPENGKNVTTLMKNADAAMYLAKEQGKNRYCFYTLDLNEAALERLQLENDLRVALKCNELMVYYQPQYSLAKGQLIGAEALVRWQHPEMGLVSPIKFIPLAEAIGLIIPIGRWVLREACAQTKAWQDAGLDIDRIGINVAG